MRGLRSIVIAAFLGTLLIFGVAAVKAVGLLNAMRAENRLLREQSISNANRLATVRYCVLLSQKYLNDPGTSDADIRDRWTQMMADPGGDQLQSNHAQLAQLRTLLNQHWAILNRAFQTTSREGSPNPDEVRPLQVSAVEITERVEDIDAQQTAATQVAVQDQFERLGRGLSLALYFSMGTALLLALGCGVYILRIERQNQGRYEEIVSGRRDLEQLSARLVEAQETERRTISRELHDQVGQTLNAVLLDAANLATRIRPDDEIGQRYLNNIRSLTDSGINSIRDISLLLRPSMLDDLGLIPALEWHARETSRRTGIDVRVSAGNVDDSLPDAIRTCVYRVVQEALQNISRHAAASHAKIDVRQSNGALALSIEDDGSGFDPRLTKGMGLLGMEERVKQLGGHLEVRSEPGKGTTLRVSLPAAVTK
jgi:signal transduction histidine kinase